jgi:hypothetical protein
MKKDKVSKEVWVWDEAVVEVSREQVELAKRLIRYHLEIEADPIVREAEALGIGMNGPKSS